MRNVTLPAFCLVAVMACEDATNPVNEHGPKPSQPAYSTSGGATTVSILTMMREG